MGSPTGKTASLRTHIRVDTQRMYPITAQLPPAIILATAAMRWVGGAILAGIFLAMLGPFGSYSNGGVFRLLIYWVGAVLLGLALYGGTFKIVSQWASPSSRRWWLILLVGTFLASVPHTFTTRAAAFWLWPSLAKLNLPVALWYAQTLVIGLLAMMSIALVTYRSARKQNGKILLEMAAQSPMFGIDVLALQMEDHYVRVHRVQGSELVLIPLGKAIERTARAGFRIHRSWWVAQHAVVAVEGNARSMRVHLSNGLIAPVARSAVAHLKSSGWIERS